MDEKLDFAVTYDSLFHQALRADVTPALKAQLRELGLDLDRPLLPGYPAALWPKVMALTAKTLYPGLEVQQAYARLGRRFIDAYFSTVLGGAVALMMRVVGPMRALGRLERSLRSAGNYQQTRFTPRGERQAELWISDVNGVSGWFVGMTSGAARHFGLEHERVTVLHDDGRSATFLLEWS